MRRVEIAREDGTHFCTAEVADNPWTRLRGLLGRRSLPVGHGLLIQPCTSIHTWFMRFPIDVVYLDKEDAVVKTASVPTYRFSKGGKGAKKVIELPLNTLASRSLQTGERLSIRSAEPVLQEGR